MEVDDCDGKPGTDAFGSTIPTRNRHNFPGKYLGISRVRAVDSGETAAVGMIFKLERKSFLVAKRDNFLYSPPRAQSVEITYPLRSTLSAMNLTIDNQPNCKAIVTVEVPQEALQTMEGKMAQSFSRNAKIAGFRPGKAPLSVITKRYANEIKSRAVEEVANDALREVYTKSGLEVLSVEDGKNEDGVEGGRRFIFTVTVKPEVILPEYKGLKIEVEELDVTEKFISQVIERQRESLADMVEVTDRPAKEGDICVVDYVGTLDGQAIKELVEERDSFLAENTGFLLKITPDNFLPGFTEQLVSAAIGETRIVRATVPAESESALAGKEVEYQVTVTGIKEQQLPEVDDAFAAKLMPGKTLEDLRVFVRERVEADTKRSVEQQKRVNVLAALSEITSFVVPQKLVDQATQRRIDELVQSNLKQGVSREILQENEEALVGAAGHQAESDVKQEFLLLEIAKAEKLQPTNEEVAAQISYVAERNNMSFQKAMKNLEKNGQLHNLRNGIVLEKAINFLIEHSEVTVKKVTSDEVKKAEEEEQRNAEAQA